jgi:hypothetical protein
VSEDADDFTPQITNLGVANPHVDAIAVLGDTTYAGGLFQQVNRGGTKHCDRVDMRVGDPQVGDLRGEVVGVLGHGGAVRGVLRRLGETDRQGECCAADNGGGPRT